MVRTLISRLLAAGLLSCASLHVVAQNPSSDVAVGIFPFLVGNMDNRIQEVVTNCQTHGIDTVYVSIFRTTGPATGDLWIDDSAGDWPASWGSVRPSGAGINLPLLIASCHAANIRCVGVLKCFDDSVQPDSASHRQYLLDVVDYFVDAWQPNGQPVYDLDGFALDYVRYVGSSTANASNVTNFVSDVRNAIGGMSLHAYVIANRFTFDGPVYNSSFQSYASVRSQLSSQFGQDWEQLAPLLDVLMPMTYTADGSIYSTYAGHQDYVAKAAEYARLACILAGVPGTRVCPVVKTYPTSSETTTPQTIDASVTGALLGGGDGYQSFRYQFLVDNPTWWTPMAQHAVPGCNWPKPGFSAAAPKLTATFDPSQSSDLDQSSQSLFARFDYDSDGSFDGPWQPVAASSTLMRRPGNWATTLQVRDADGHVATTRRRFATGSPVTVFPTSLNTATGGLISVFLDAGPGAAGQTYLALATLSGTAPGFSWGPDMQVPLNIDALTTFITANPNGGLMSNGLGTFNGQGRATVSLTFPGQVLTFLAGFQVHWTFVAQNFLATPTCIGDAKAVLLQ